MTGQVLDKPQVNWRPSGEGATMRFTTFVNGLRLTVKPVLTRGDDVYRWAGLIGPRVEVMETDELEHCKNRLVQAAGRMN